MLKLEKAGRFRDSNQITPNPSRYSFLPFRFERLDGDQVVIVTEAGQHVMVNTPDFEAFASKDLSNTAPAYRMLRNIGALVDENSTANTRLQILKLRTKYREMPWFTGLHMMVVTLRCNQSCPYCQVSRQSEDRAAFDMSVANADLAIEHIFKSPNPSIKIEFQGGESLLNFELIKHVVQSASGIKLTEGRNLAFVAATNMTHVSDEVIDFFGENGVFFSTSIDGPADLHNANRPYKGGDAFEIVCNNIRRVQQRLGRSAVSALMTTTARSLGRHRDIIDQYVELGFDGIFLRSLSPYGFAIKTRTYYEYSSQEWVDFYLKALEYILQLNRDGLRFIEYFTSLILTKILRLQNTGFVNLQSPAGLGTMGVIYDFNGRIYGSDEGRMMSQMGDEQFLLGHVRDDYESIF
ncbi:MAG: His-Xaa-Ser system radical SAM maturase HxsB, partial [Verrucomicrobiales bacterium]